MCLKWSAKAWPEFGIAPSGVNTDPEGARLAREGGLMTEPFLTDVHRSNCGSWLACESGLMTEPFLTDVHRSNCRSWLACEGGLMTEPFLTDVHRSNCRSWLACESGLMTEPFLTDVHRSNCGSWLACESGLMTEPFLTDVHRSNCGSWLACDGLTCAAFIRFTRVIVNEYRWQASSYKGACPRFKKSGAFKVVVASAVSLCVSVRRTLLA